jgi:hypothetical protein
MKKTKKKPDLLIVLAIFVALGVLISTYTQSTIPKAKDSAATADTSNSTPTKTTDDVYTGNFLKVTEKQ